MAELHIPRWTVGDRIYKVLKDANLGVADVAEYLGVHRKTVGNWISGNNEAPVAALRLIALRCGVPFEWLANGTAPAEAAEAVSVRRQGLEPRTR